jgi:hypothetical protein
MNTTRLPLNPFRYGKPVPPERFVGREDALRTVFARVVNSDSTAIVGEPHIGKSSFLRYIRDAQVQADWLGSSATYAFIDLDCHLIAESYQPTEFWHEVLDRAMELAPSEPIRRNIESVRQGELQSFTLRRMFDQIGRDGMQIVLLIDEFDVLLHHPNFNTAGFFGTLRSLAIQTDGLALVTSSRLPVAEMNRRCYEINPVGSPFFNNLIEVRLLPLQPAEIDLLIDQALGSSPISFTPEDRAYITRISGRHPFLVQIASAALFDIITQQHSAADRNAAVEQLMLRRAIDHFEDVWRHLNEETRRAMLLLAQAELDPVHVTGGSVAIEQYDTELRWLADGRMIEQADDEQCARWRGARWRVSARMLARWIIDSEKWADIAGRASVLLPNDTERAERIAFLREKLAETRRRLNQRELQLAKLGVTADPAIANEVESMKRTLADDERELHRLGG